MEQAFFIIDGRELFLDKVLVEFDETPVFFVCKNKSSYFIALNIDLNEERYILSRISLNGLSKMLHGKITMRELVLQSDKYWDIMAGEELDKDTVCEKSIEEIPLELLPYEGAYLKIVTRELEVYMEEIDANLYGESGWENEAVQVCIECIEELTRSLSDQFETMIQQICDNVTKDMKIRTNYDFHDGDYSKEISRAKVEIEKDGSKTNIKFQDNKGFPFAA